MQNQRVCGGITFNLITGSLEGCVLHILLFALCILIRSGLVAENDKSRSASPNIVLIYADDLGWGDLGCYGSRNIRTPHLDKLARQGVRFTSFYVAQPVCSASRAALLTGCYPNRIGIHGALGPNSRIGISSNEVTLAELLKSAGYATAIFGKWHLGDSPRFLPTAHGFDEYFGLPYSNDMWPHHPTAKPGTYPPLPLIEGTNVIEVMPDQRYLTQRYTERAVSFIERNHTRPFFLYVPYTMPHVPLFAGPTFEGRSSGGLYGDVIEEMDASVGSILATLDRFKLSSNTWIIFISDNGPWHNYGDHAGSAGPFREGKGSVFEGGVRVPCIMRWPGKIAGGRVLSQPAMTLDLVPTIASRLNLTLPTHGVDGKDLWSVFSGRKGAVNPTEAYAFYYGQGELQALRSGPWKLHFPHIANGLAGNPPGSDGRPGNYKRLQMGLELYNLESDPAETRNLAANKPEIVERLSRYAEEFRTDLGDSLTKRLGRGIRSPGRNQDEGSSK